MKNKIITTIIIGVLIWFPIITQAQSNYNDRKDDKSGVHLIKGKVLDSNHDGVWDLVTFGLKGSKLYSVTYVDVFTSSGKFLGTISELENHRRDGITWYSIDLDDFKATDEFYLSIHIVKGNSFPDIFSDLALVRTLTAISPNDPEETVIIVKYP
jgi:hypothetical protein